MTIPWSVWQGDPAILVGLFYLEGAYLMGVGPLRRRLRLAERFPYSEAATFTLGVLVIYLALQSPLHVLSERYLLSAHMVQHLLLTLVAAPLLALGTPPWLLRPLLRFRPVAQLGRRLTSPMVAFALFNGFLTFSHFPIFYDLALRAHDVHAIQHLVYLITAVLAWWPVASRSPELPRISYPAQMLYLFAQTIPTFLIGALITFSSDPAYPTYAASPRIWGLSALDDQRIGGLLMWIGGSLYYLGILAVVFFSWFNHEEMESRRTGDGLAAR